MNKKIFSLIILGVFLFSILPITSAFFVKNHAKWIIQGFDEVSGSGTVADLCRPYINVFIDGQISSDAPVVHYYDTGSNSKVTSYISTHTFKGGKENCLIEAGSDTRRRCYCYGLGIHSIEDQFSHLENGVVPKYLSKNLAPNFLGHMTIEQSFETKSMERLAKENPSLFARVENYNKVVLNTMFIIDSNGALVPSDLMQLFADSSGIDPVNDVKLFRSGYLGEGFYNTVYKDKVRLPGWGYYIPAIIAIIGLIGTVGLLFLGRNKFKYIAIIPWVFLILLGGFIFYSYIQGNTWQITSKLIEIPASLGYLSVSDADIVLYDELVQKAVNQYMRDGILNVPDASGLDFIDKEGVAHKGALNQASKGFFWVFWLIGFPLIMFVLGWSIYRSFKTKR